MFTGIVEELGSIVAIDTDGDAARVTVRGPKVLNDVSHGASIAVNGVCLTVTDWTQDTFTVDVMAETLRRTSVGAQGDPVNLERAMRADGRFGGHIVQGHVDGTTSIQHRDEQPHWTVVRFGLPTQLAPYVVEKGSITIDGVSLTVSAVGQDYFEVSLIPTTLELTTLGRKGIGDLVNLEVDVLAKYVERLMK